MSVINKIRELTSDMEELAKEKPVITLISDTRLLAENYNSIKLFESEQIILNLGRNDLIVNGSNLVIDYFSSAKLMVRGTFSSISFLSGGGDEL